MEFVASTRSLRNSDDTTSPFIFSPTDAGADGFCEVVYKPLSPPSSCSADAIDTTNAYQFCFKDISLDEEVTFGSDGVLTRGNQAKTKGVWYYTPTCEIVAYI